MYNIDLGTTSDKYDNERTECSSDSGIPGSFTSHGFDKFKSNYIKCVEIKHRTSLGISICGGVNDSKGPYISIAEVIPGGDIHSVSYWVYFLFF